MSIQVNFLSAAVYCGLDEHPDFREAMSNITYVFASSDQVDLPTDPIALISWTDRQVDCVLSHDTWHFPPSMNDRDLVELVTILVRDLLVTGPGA